MLAKYTIIIIIIIIIIVIIIIIIVGTGYHVFKTPLSCIWSCPILNYSQFNSSPFI